MTDKSLLPASPHVQDATIAFLEAARLVKADDLATARLIIERLDDAALRAHWDAVQAEPARRGIPNPPTHNGPTVQRDDSAALVRATFDRDGWHCTWCGTRVVAGGAFARMHATFPDIFPRDATNAGRHGLILAATASHDHVVPISRGGTNDLDNLVTACWPCQFARGNWTIEEVGLDDPRRRAPFTGDWDGVAWFA